MRRQDLKNGMSFKERNGNKYIIIQNNVYRDCKKMLSPCSSLNGFLKRYSDGLKDLMTRKDFDIMQVYDIDNKLIWERKEVDWSKIPVDTKVLVRNSQYQKWECRYFAKYEDGIVYTFLHGATSWSVGELNRIIPWEEAKLVEDKKVENVNIGKIERQFREYCKCDGKRCTLECKYCGSISCRFAWLLDNYNISPR